MPTLGRGLCHPQGPHPVAGLKEGGFNIQNPGGRGIFLKNPWRFCWNVYRCDVWQKIKYTLFMCVIIHPVVVKKYDCKRRSNRNLLLTTKYLLLDMFDWIWYSLDPYCKFHTFSKQYMISNCSPKSQIK